MIDTSIYLFMTAIGQVFMCVCFMLVMNEQTQNVRAIVAGAMALFCAWSGWLFFLGAMGGLR
jgi:hypothetical protein